MAKNPLLPKRRSPQKFIQAQGSKGILDDHAIRKVIFTKEIGGKPVFIGGGLPFGEIFVNGNAVETAISLSGKANKVQISVFDTNGENNNTTPDQTQNHITINKAGKYLVTISSHIDSVAGSGSTMGMSLYKNNGSVEFINLHAHRNFTGGGGESGSVSISGIVDLAENDNVEVWIWNNTNTQNYIVMDITLSILQIGG